MSLSKRIAEERDKALMEQAGAELEAERSRQETAGRRIEVVTSRLNVTSMSLQVELRSLTEGLGTPRHYVFGDLVVSVQLFEYVDKDDVESPERPKLLLAQYYVSLVGIDKRSGGVHTIRIGTLKFFRYEGLYEAVTKAPSYMDFDLDKVLAAIGHA